MRVEVEKGFVDGRGSIQNLVAEPVGNVALVTSKRGSVRSNHWHIEDWHYLYVLSGRMLYFERALDDRQLPEPVSVSKGEMVYTGPGREHACLFLEDSEVLSMARAAQTHFEHENDTKHVAVLDRETADRLLRAYGGTEIQWPNPKP